MGQIATCWRGHRISDLESELRRARSDCEEERRAREQLGGMLTSNEQELKKMRDWVITSDEIEIRRDQRLGEGAWGIVYRGKFQGCDVAVKEIHPIIMSNRIRQLFEREVDIASRCRHPCLLQFIGATTGDRPLLVTEIMECSLSARLYNQTDPLLSDPEITTIALDVAKALNYLHQKRDPIIHHDISSGNVLLRRQGDQWRAKVSDYGTANFVRQSSINYAGNASYCAPESLREDPSKPISCKVGIVERWKVFSGQKLRTFKLSACYIDSMENLSKVSLVTVFALFHLVACCVCGDETITGGNVQCKILGQSGKIRLVYIGNNTEGNFSDSNDNQLTFEVDSIYERDAQGNEVGKIGPKKHSLNRLAIQEFNFTKVENVSYYQGIKVINVNLTAYLDGPQATLDVMVFLFLEDGNVTFGNESFAVFKGTLKFNIKIKDWEFCDPGLSNCEEGQTKEEGAFIDITLAVKSKGTPSKLSKEDRGKAKKKPVCYKDMDCPETYDMGGGSEVLINKEILLDDDPVDMLDPFPKYETQGSRKLFIFRIPRFNNTALIDPTANMDGVAGEPTTGGDGGGNGDGGNGGGDGGESTTGPPNGSAPMLLLNVFVLVFPLLAAITLSVF